MRYKRKLVNLLVAATALTAALSACGSTSGNGNSANGGAPNDASPSVSAGSSSEAPSSSAPSGEKATISFIHWRGEDAKAFDAIIGKFERENPNITVETQVFPSDQYQSTAQAKLADGSVGDVFASFPGAQFASIAKAGLYADLSGAAFLSNFLPSLIEAGQQDGKQLAVPYQLVYNIPIYNADIFAKYGLEPPKDWDGFLAAAEKLKSEGLVPIAFPGADIGPGQFMNPMVMNNAPDPDIFAKLEAGETKLTDEWWVKTLSQFKELSDKGYFQKDALGTKDQGAGALFAQGKAAILATGSYQLAQNKKNNPELNQKLLAPITVSEDQAVYEGIHTTTFMLGVNAKSKHPEEAKKFIEFLSRKDIAGEYANATGQNVTVKDVEYTSDELKTVAEWTDKKTRFQPRFTITNAEIQKAVTSSIQAVLGGKSPEQAAREAQAIVDQQIGK
ncbi:ABC transporter substrate-binding protein [Cohnella thailandensis]|uniref:Extracellular solute-binding protein n=1 Tax=Cohnella thailandensis TaxID=557557 RepID=A0A841SZ03_9BACL|nr:extracellular solute-binding protein [Cohnella thailandensis]MBB6637433.1 extracellular solute-binding protein [Cohnella thailandensis]MBP1976763.1 raffinose/stachyose/melibiose transport system substrate-binding protein [Cohnella thailandensis]